REAHAMLRGKRSHAVIGCVALLHFNGGKLALGEVQIHAPAFLLAPKIQQASREIPGELLDIVQRSVHFLNRSRMLQRQEGSSAGCITVGPSPVRNGSSSSRFWLSIGWKTCTYRGSSSVTSHSRSVLLGSR